MSKRAANFPTAIEPAQAIERICLRLLSRREHSRRELLDKLAVRGYNRRDVDPVLDSMRDSNWQDDRRYAESYARSRIENGYGPARIAFELQRQGVENFDLEALADELAGGWRNALLSVYINKYGEARDMTAAEWLKRSRFLQQRGFSGEMIKSLHKELNIKFSRLEFDENAATDF